MKKVSLRITASSDGVGFGVVISEGDRSNEPVPLGSLGEVHRLREVFDRNASEDDRREAGDLLYEALLGGGVADHWATLRAGCTADSPLRVVLDIEPAELRSLPWELMRQRGAWLWRRPELLMRRGAAVPAVDVGMPEAWPLRVLVVIGTPARDEQALAEQELAALSGVLECRPGQAHVEVLDCPDSARELAEAIDELRPHAVHFIAHGMQRASGGSPELSFTTESGGGWQLCAEDVADLTQWQPRLVVLNACHLAQADPADWVGGIAQAFSDTGARAVISMQADIKSSAAVVFTRSFYEGLVRGLPIDECMAAARSALGKLPERTGEWALPVLLTSTEPDAVLPLTIRSPEGFQPEDIHRHKQYIDLRRFVGQVEERRQAWWALDDPRSHDGVPKRSVLVIGGHSHGDFRRTGKTWLSNWCQATWFLRGHQIISVDLSSRLAAPGVRAGGGTRRKDWLTVLRTIREQAISSDQLCSLPKDAFRDFNAELNRLVVGHVQSVEGAGAGQEDEWNPFNDDVGHADERKRDIMAAFVSTLRRVASDQPLILALDHADRIMEESLGGELYEGLIRPIAYGKAAPLRLVLVAPDNWMRPIIPDADSHVIGRVQVGDFRRGQLVRLARAYSQRLGCEPNKATIGVVEALARQPQEYFGVDLFECLTPHVDQWAAAINKLEAG